MSNIPAFASEPQKTAPQVNPQTNPTPNPAQTPAQPNPGDPKPADKPRMGA